MVAAETLPRHFRLEHRLRRRIRISAPSLRLDPERLYTLEILLRKRAAIRSVRVIPGLGGVVIDYNPSQLPEGNLCTLLDAVIPNLGSGKKRRQNQTDTRTSGGTAREIHFAIEGISCASCALLIELVVRDPLKGRGQARNLIHNFRWVAVIHLTAECISQRHGAFPVRFAA